MSTAGILRPVLVNYIREFQIDRGVAPSDAYTFTMYGVVGILAIGVFCNMAVRPVSPALFTTMTSADRREAREVHTVRSEPSTQ